jgi:hypothetical protein
VTAPAPRHAAPDVGFNPATDPCLIRAAWISQHGLRHLPDRIRSHRYVQVCEVAR